MRAIASRPAITRALVENERLWFKLLMRLARRRVDDTEDMDTGIITLMLQERALWLRN